MFNNLFLICVLISICTSNCVILENICDVFRYNGTEVNSVFRMRFMNDFKTISHYLADENVKYDDLVKNKTQIEMINKSRKLFNYEINKIYSENFINKNLKNVTDLILSIGDYMKTYKEIAPYLNEDNRKILAERFNSQFGNGIFFWLKLHQLSNELADHMDEENTKLLVKRIQNMSIKNGEKFAFEGEEIFQILSFKSIASLVTFVESKMKSTLITDILLPFYNPNYRKTTRCLSSKKLPKFYRESL